MKTPTVFIKRPNVHANINTLHLTSCIYTIRLHCSTNSRIKYRIVFRQRVIDIIFISDLVWEAVLTRTPT